jgi:hypothetical protein
MRPSAVVSLREIASLAAAGRSCGGSEAQPPSARVASVTQAAKLRRHRGDRVGERVGMGVLCSRWPCLVAADGSNLTQAKTLTARL